MTIEQLTEAIDQQVLAGDIVGAFQNFAADNCITHSTESDKTENKQEKIDRLNNFFANIAAINRIELQGSRVTSPNESHSQFSFDFTNRQGEQLHYNEVIRRVWSNDQLVEEQYLLNQNLPEEKTAAKPKKKATRKTTKGDKLTTIEGVGPKIAKLLTEAGFDSFAALANADTSALKTILEGAGSRYKMHDPTTWPEQAALARDGKTEELEKLQEVLKGGKK